MSGLEPLRLSPEDLDALRSALRRGPETLSFATEPALAGLLASVGIQRETGTKNDEMARFAFDADLGTPVPRESLIAELVRFRGAIGVRIRAKGHPRLDLRFRGIRELLHPDLSFNPDGTIRECVIFPETIARIAARQGVRLVVVRNWAMNTVFGGFDPSKHYYQTNLWELENNDTLRFARLLEDSRIPFQGTHDLVAHVSGIAADQTGSLAQCAIQVKQTLEDYFGAIRVPTIASLILPYAAGVLLDDLAQPPNYGAENRKIVIDELLIAIGSRVIDPTLPRMLARFPDGYAKTVYLGRAGDLARVKLSARQIVARLVAEIQDSSVPLGTAG